MTLAGKTLVITGVASGIGAQTLEMAASAGARVIGIDIAEPKGAAPMSAFHRMDLADAASIEAVCAKLPEGIDAVMNIAGVSSKLGIEKTLAINFYGTRLFTDRVVPKMRDGGAIVSVASIAARGWRANIERIEHLSALQGIPGLAEIQRIEPVTDEEVYNISKEMLLVWTMAMTRPLLARSIRINAVSPGPVDTVILDDFRATLGEEEVSTNIRAVERAGTVADIAPPLLWLVSEQSAWINGVCIPVDGGLDSYHLLKTYLGV